MGCMNVPHGETIHFDIVTHHPLTGELSDADSAPTWEVYSETSDIPVDLGLMTRRTDKTGHYRASFQVATVNGFDPGEFFIVVIEATVDAVTAKTVVMTLRVLAAESTIGKVAVDDEAIADTVLSRDMSQVEGNAPEHSLCTVVLAALESSISSTEWIIRRTDGIATHVTKTVTTDADADPITGVS